MNILFYLILLFQILLSFKRVGDIIWKIISLKDILDHELAKQFAEFSGHEFVIEILLSKEKGKSSKVRN
jgi:hypothetical protein